MHMKKVSLSFVFLLCLTAISHVARAQQTFQNPVITASLPDPSIIRAADGYYYLSDIGFFEVRRGN